jgi:hypothetical protein
MLKNELLQQAQATVEASVTDAERFRRLVASGQKAMFDEKTFGQLFDSLVQSEDPVAGIAQGLSSLLNILAHQARGTIPHDVLLQAGTVLLFEALDFAEQTGLIQVDNDTLAQAVQGFIEALLPSVGLDGTKLDGLLGEVGQTMSDPQRLEAYAARQGAPR